MAIVVSFINFKGGVGKTTLCVEIAASLAYKFKEKVLIVDLDPQTNATLSLMPVKKWEKHSKEKGTLKDFFDACYESKDFNLEKILVRRPVNYSNKLDNLDLIPSHIELFGMDLKLATKYGHNNIQTKLFLKKALKPLLPKYDYIFIDCPPNLYLATQNGIFASEYYLIVALAEYLSTLGIAHIQKSVDQLFIDAKKILESMDGNSSALNPPVLLGIIFNRVRYFTGGTSNEKEIMAQIRRKYPELTFTNFVPQSTQIASRPQTQIPIAVSGYAADRKYEERIKAVAEEFYDRITTPRSN